MIRINLLSMTKTIILLVPLLAVFIGNTAVYGMSSEKSSLIEERKKEILLINPSEVNDSTFTEKDTEYLEHVDISILKTSLEATTRSSFSENHNNQIHYENNKERVITSLTEYQSGLVPKQWHVEDFNIRNIWDYTSMDKITVAVIDSGINNAHPYFNGKITPGFNFLEDNTDTFDDNGHGTAVSGVIRSLIGPFPVEILPLKTTFSNGVSYVSDIVRAINYAIDQKVDVINLSFGSSIPSEAEQQAINAAINDGIVVVSSSGNNGSNRYSYPASYDGVISVSSINEDHKISSFSITMIESLLRLRGKILLQQAILELEVLPQ